MFWGTPIFGNTHFIINNNISHLPIGLAPRMRKEKNIQSGLILATPTPGPLAGDNSRLSRLEAKVLRMGSLSFEKNNNNVSQLNANYHLKKGKKSCNHHFWGGFFEVEMSRIR